MFLSLQLIKLRHSPEAGNSYRQHLPYPITYCCPIKKFKLYLCKTSTSSCPCTVCSLIVGVLLDNIHPNHWMLGCYCGVE
jgi:hypothetical protein